MKSAFPGHTRAERECKRVSAALLVQAQPIKARQARRVPSAVFITAARAFTSLRDVLIGGRTIHLMPKVKRGGVFTSPRMSFAFIAADLVHWLPLACHSGPE